MRMENPPWMKMDFPIENGGFSNVMVVFRGGMWRDDMWDDIFLGGRGLEKAGS